MAEYVMRYKRKLNFDLDVLLPVAMMHDLHHSGILEEHFRSVLIIEKLNGEGVVPISPGAKIAKDLLEEIKYNPSKIEEIIDILNVHHISHLKRLDINKIYNTPNKKAFHDIELLTRFTRKKMHEIKKICPTRKEFIELMRGQLKLFFYEKLKDIAKNQFIELEDLKRPYGRLFE